jgi:hypothetical protein
LLIDPGGKAAERFFACGGVLIDTGVLQNRCKHLAGFLQDDAQGTFFAVKNVKKFSFIAWK